MTGVQIPLQKKDLEGGAIEMEFSTRTGLGLVALASVVAITSGDGSFLEDWSSAPGLSTAYTAFAGTRAQAMLTAENEIWIGTIDGLETATGTTAYNSPLGLPGDNTVLGMGPLFLGTEIVLTFDNYLDALSFDVFDIETLNAVRLVAFDDEGTEVFDSGNVGRNLTESFSFEFNPSARSVSIRTVNGDGILLSHLTARPEPLPCNAVDLERPFGVLDIQDIGVFVSAFTSQASPADLNGDLVYDLQDVVIFIDAFVNGCP